MPAAQFAGLLIQTAVVYRRPQTNGEDVKDRFGQPVPATTGDEYVTLPCRVTAARGGRQFGERATDVIETTHELFLEAGADIVEDDVVTVLAAPVSEADLEASARIVEQAVVKLRRPVMDGIGEHHVEVELTTQRPATSAAEPEVS